MSYIIATDYLSQFKAENLALFTGFPKNNEEEWRYTRLSALEKQVFNTIPANNTLDLINYKIADAWHVVFINGQFSSELSNLKELPNGVVLTSLLQVQPEQLKHYLGQAVNANEHSFIRFNNANFSDGLFLHIPENVILEKPLQLLHIVSETNTLAATRNIIALESNAQAQIIESFVSIDNFNYLTANVNEVFLAQNAQLNWYKVQVESENASHFGGTYTQQSNNSYFSHYNIALGALLARNDVHNDLKNGAECELNGLTVVAKRQHCDNHTRIIHAEPNGISREYYKSIADNRARAVFQGRIIVAEHAQKTSSTMNNRNLLLSSDAEIDTKPQLEIYADDVQCSHGVTIGQLSEQSIFYLQSRGIDEQSARNILTFAFANEMVDKITITSLKQWIFMLLSKHFPQKVLD